MGKVIRKETTECLCGVCGQTPKSGRFIPGHDQKLRKILEGKVGGLEALKGIVEALERHLDGNLTEQTVHRILARLEELESIRVHFMSGAEAEESDWLRAAACNPAFDFLKEAGEDIYTLTDGRPFHNAR